MSTTLYTVDPVTKFSAAGYDIVQAGTVVPDALVWAITTAAAGAGVTLNTSAGGAPQLVQVPSYYNGGTGAPVGDVLPVGAEVKDSTGAVFEKTPGGWIAASAQPGTFALADASATSDQRLIKANAPAFTSAFSYSAISTNQDGWLTWKNMAVASGFGGQVGQGGAISYFKAVGGSVSHTGPGNLDVFWTSVTHHGTREAGMFIGDISADQGGNVYGAHFRLTSTRTAPVNHFGLFLESIPNVARSSPAANTLGTTIPAGTPRTSVALGTAVQLTTGTNLTFTADDASTVVAYVSSDMGALATTVPVTSFTSTSQISAGSTVTVGVQSIYHNALIRNAGSQGMTSAITIDAAGSTATQPYLFALRFDSTAASPSGTAMQLGGTWGAGIDFNGNTAINIGSITATGTSPNRDVRIADNLLLDNARYVKFKDSGGTAQKAISGTSSNNIRFKLIAASTQFEFYDNAETTLLARITSSGRGDFSAAGLTTKYTSGATQPGFTTNGQVETWHDSAGGGDYLVVNVNGVSKKVAVA